MKSMNARRDEVPGNACHLLGKREGNSFFGTRYAAIYDELMREVAYGTWLDYIEDVARLNGAQVHHILDLGCGTGSFALHALLRGMKITAVDISAAMLRIFREKLAGHSNQDRCQIVRAELSDFRLAESVDFAVSFLDTLNYVIDPKKFESGLICAFQALRPRGVLLFDVNTEYALRSNRFLRSGVLRRNDGVPLSYKLRGEFCALHKLYGLDICFRDSLTRNVLFEEFHLERSYSCEFILSCLQRVGFGSVRTFRAFSFEEPSPTDERMSFVAVRTN
jgi:SAM-dependent methyltransferase